MELEKMNLADIEERLNALDVEVRDAKDVEAVKNAVEERQALEARKAEIIALEERNATAEAIRKGEDNNVVVVEERKGEKNMEERTFGVDTVEYRNAYLKSLMGKSLDMEERTALSVAANIIPTETVNKIYGKLEENPLIAELDALHVPGYLSVPTATTVNDASWVAMGTDSTDSADVIGKVSLTAKKLIKTIEITADVQAMSIPAFEGWLVAKLAQKMEKAICAAVINGAGSNDAKGVGQQNITASAAITTATVAKLSKFMAGVKSAYHAGAVWVMSSENFYTHIAPLANDSNGVVLMNGVQPMLLGHKVIFNDAVDACKFKTGGSQEASNADHIIFGNFKEGYVFNYGEGIAIEADQSVAFRSGSTVYRAMALCDGAVVDEDAFAWTTIA